jgi:potassium efflux system protein
MRRCFISPVIVLLLSVAANVALAQSTKAAELTTDLIEARLSTLAMSGAEDSNETRKVYETALAWLNAVASHERDAVSYLAQLTSAPRKETAIVARIDALGVTDDDATVIESFSRERLESHLMLVRTELREATNALDSIEQRLAARETNASVIRTRLNQIALHLGGISHLESPIDPNASPSLAEASQWNAMAERKALSAEQRALEARLASQPVRYSVLQTQGAELDLRIEKLTAQERLSENIARGELLHVARPEESGISPDNPLYAVLKRLTSDNSQLNEEQFDIEARLDKVNNSQTTIDKATRSLSERFTKARRVVEFASDSEILGEVLLAYWQEVKTFRLPEVTVRLPQLLGNTVIRRIGHEQALAELANTSKYATVLIDTAGLDPTANLKAEKEIIIELARAKRELLRRIITVESDYIDGLSNLDSDYARLVELANGYKEYLSALILWLPSRHRLWESNLGDIPSELSRLRSALGEISFTIDLPFLMVVLVAGILVYARPRFKTMQQTLNARIVSPREDSIGFTFAALCLSGLRALPVPLLLFAFGVLLSQNSSPAEAALSKTLEGLALTLYSLTLIHILCEENGVARFHFGWRPQLCENLRRESLWLIRLWLPVATLASFLFMMDNETVLLGRLTLLLSLFVIGGHLASLTWRGMRIDGRLSLSTGQNRLRLILIAIIIVIIAGVVWGLRYSVSILTSSLLFTLLIGVGLLILHNFFMRWLRVARRHLYTAQTEISAGENANVPEEPDNLVGISTEVMQFLNAATLTATVVALLYIWAPLLPIFDAAARVTLWTSTSVVEGESIATKITLETLLVVLFLVGVTFYAARKLPALVELVLRSRTNATPGARYTTSALLSYFIVGIGVFTALSTLGLQWSQLQWLVAALGVGIGFGLQEIVANFISGLIILFERPIRVGDVVTVGDREGTVTKIRIRATTISDFDNRELLVPNKEFITGRLLNWTLSDACVRLSVPVGIAYGSDVERALRILWQVADDDPDVLKDPEPSIIFWKFGDNALELSSRFYISSVDDYWPVTTAVHSEIHRRFAEAGISISFPQRDVHLNTPQPIRIAIDPAPNM